MPGRPVPRVRSCLRSPHNAQRRAHATKVLRGDDLGPVVQDEHQTFRLRHDGSKLPLPPVLDPVVVEQRARWKQQKAKPDVAGSTPFQKKLLENPYAHVLASPVRIDRSLSTLLPSALLLTLHIKPHPATLEPWLLPLSLSTPNPPKYLGPPLRFLAHRHNAAHLTARKEVWKKVLGQRFYPFLGPRGMAQLVWRKDMPELLLQMLRARVEDKLAWWFKWRGRLTPVASPSPSDTQDVEDVACVLFYGSLKSRADEIHDEANAIVAEADKWTDYFRTGYGKAFDPHATPPPHLPKATHPPPAWFQPLVPRLAPRAQFPPLDYPTTRWRGRKVAVYSLTDMLGVDRAEALIGRTRYEGERCWVMKRGRQTVDVQMLLGQLQSYLAESGAVWWPR
ncbi:uncharacterized protein CC84DRAFT_1097826 [Paraphaeosphaeria sporulosa]|uniref:Uncharacterized protein n=1 Tax=Paraphaeosphaeria sporulosa TaxID=1460663 RepID=A0A177C4N9_9PLEO|nr:uncharacterized protein CC84DRAFT_1097826 [Paraphaeosphaeria sporulosa]OAG02704.1 hypothetical protein CC84DRAFT_1097826 [Paraphaeosphaeria sporulosa]